MKKFKINQENAVQRLDVFLAEQIADLSRSQLQKLIKSGTIKVNGEAVTPHYALKEEDEIAIESASPSVGAESARPDTEKRLALTRSTKETKKTPLPKIKILAETADYLVINKPTGLIVHGAPHITEPTLVDWLLKKYPEIKTVGDSPERPGIVHRLDKDVSGLMVIALTQDFFNKIKKQFQGRTTEKKYTALVHGKIAKDEFKIDFLIERATTGHKMAARPTSQEGKTATSEVKVLKRFINYTLVKVKIITGRTHQVRAHLAAYGNPLVGDNLYGTRQTKLKNQKLGTERVYLVADELSFKDLQGEKQSFKIELPEEFTELLGKIK